MQQVLETPFEIKPLSWSGANQEFVRTVGQTIRNGNGVLIGGFPSDENELVAFVSRFGQPLANYNKKSGIESGGSTNPYVNLVKLARPTDGRGLLHGKGGPLPIHTARSWREPRPKLFALLMVSPGWRDRPPGENGESLFVSVAETLAAMAAEDSGRFRRVFSLLTGQRVRFEADNVRETTSDLPVLYTIEGQKHDLDVGMRLKQDLAKKLAAAELFGGDVTELQAAVGWLQDTANRLAHRVRMPLQPGDLVIFDNNRWGHGRCPYEGAREIHGALQLSPREVWSLTVA